MRTATWPLMLAALVFLLGAPRFAEAHAHTVCKEGKTTVVEGDNLFKKGLERGWWTAGACPAPEPEPEPPVTPPAPQPPPPSTPPPAPTPQPLPSSTIKPGPMICKAFADVRGADVLVFTNVTDRPSQCNIWKFRSDGTLYETSELRMGPREKHLVAPGLGFFGWWRVNCSEPWKGARQQPNLDVAGTGGAMEREATECLD